MHTFCFVAIYKHAVNVEIFVGDYFCGQATPTKIKPTKICTAEELATVVVITAGYVHPQKFIPTKIYPHKNLTHEILSP